MRRIAFRSRYHEAAWAGSKRATIRRGRLHVEPGERVLLTCGKRTPLVALVDRVSYTLVGFLQTADALRDGFTTLDELRDALDEVYPGIPATELVTVVSWRPDWEATRGLGNRGNAARAATPAP